MNRNDCSNETSNESGNKILEETSTPACDEVSLFGPDPGRTYEREVLVLGIGNILWADEGFGPRAAEAFHTAFRLPDGCEVMDGGTLGGYLLNDITVTRSILVFDCCDFHEEPGTMMVLRDDDVEPWLTTKISPHQTGFSELLATAALMGRAPESLVVVGVQPERLDDYGGSLSDTLRNLLDEAVELGRAEVARWGFDLARRPEGAEVAPLMAACVEEAPYEEGRPCEAEACRIGDERFLVRPAGVHVEDPSFERK